jgi:predicted peptidase
MNNLKSILTFTLFFFFVLQSTKAQEKTISLYDGPAPGSENWDWREAENAKNGWNTRIVYNVSRPTLTVFRPETGKSNGTSVVICPGGAFRALSIDSEGYDVARWLVGKGVTCFVLRYRLVRSMTDDPVKEMAADWGTPKFEAETRKVLPLCIADGRAAIRWVRSRADEYGLDPSRVGIMGFSAGGSVAASTAYGYGKEDRPDFIAPVYPFFPAEMQGRMASDAPPAFIVAASDDGLDLAPHSVALYNQWLKEKKSAELHLYSKGGHGFGMRVQNLPSDKWIERFGEWLQTNRLLTKSAYNPAMNAYQRREFVTEEGRRMPYRILFPDNYDKRKKYPLVLFLHGAGERGTDNERQLIHGSKMFLDSANRKKHPAIVLLPQCPEDSYWASVKQDLSTRPIGFEFDYSAPPTWPLEAANRLVRKIAVEEAVDTSRIYVTGLSMGGMGTFESVYRYPNTFAAALPICGGGNEKAYDQRVRGTAFWVFHGDKDGVVDVQLSRNMVKRLKELKAKEAVYSEYPGVNHNSWENAFAEPEFLGWMFRQKRR